MPPQPLYIDNHATTPCAPSVVEEMVPYFSQHFGNAGSRQHTYGLRAEAAVKVARERVAALVGAQPREILFTSGATESNNLAILGAVRAKGPEGAHLITCATEHKAVLDPMHHLADREGCSLTVLTPDATGRLDPQQVADALQPNTVMVSVMLANNEIGTLQPIREIGQLCKAHGAWFHTDCAQATGKLPIAVKELGVDLLSLTAHKMYGPKGIGALYVRAGRPRIALRPLQHGGGQERSWRSGTLPVPLIVGLGAAAQLAMEDLRRGEPARLAALRDRLWEQLSILPGAHRHGDPAHCLPHNLNLRFDGIPATDVMRALPDFAFSTGSACSTTNPKPSHVLKAIGLTDAQALSALRFGLGRDTTDDQVNALAAALQSVVSSR